MWQVSARISGLTQGYLLCPDLLPQSLLLPNLYHFECYRKNEHKDSPEHFFVAGMDKYFPTSFWWSLSVLGFPGGSEVKASACNAGDLGLIPGSERSPGGGNGNPLQYCCLENPMDRGAWWATVHGVTNRHD